MNNITSSKKIAEKLSLYVKYRLLKHRDYINSTGEDKITSSEALERISDIEKNRDSIDYLVNNNNEYNNLKRDCSGRIVFTDEEIETIANGVLLSAEKFGFYNSTIYLNIVDLAANCLDKLIKEKESSEDKTGLTELSLLRTCLQLDKSPLYYEPLACMILCNYVNCALRIDNGSGDTLYLALDNGKVLVDDMDSLMDANTDNNTDGLEAVEVATDWWSRVLTDPTYALRYDSGPSYLSVILAVSRNMLGYVPDKETLAVFRKSLAEKIESELENKGNYTIKMNCNVDPILQSAMIAANIPSADLSYSAMMNISRDEVVLTIGNNNSQILYSSKNNQTNYDSGKVLVKR